jgi:hypothetical protein
MAETTISLARVVELKVPIVWQEAVEIVRALEGASFAQGTLITLEDALISTDGTVRLAPAGPAHDVWLSPLRLLGRLLDGVSMPPELRSLIGSDADALSSFPSESESPEKSVTLDWFSRPDGASLIGRLAARGIAAYAATATTNSAPAAEVSTVLPTPIADYWPPGAFAPPSPAFAPKPRQPEWSAPPAPSKPVVSEAPRAVPVKASPAPLVPKAVPAPPAAEASRSPLVKGVGSLQTALTPTANSLLEQLRRKLSQLPVLRERVSTIVRLRENLPDGVTGVVTGAGAATLLMVVTAWAWLPARAEVPTIAARGPVLVGSAVVNFAVPVANLTPSAYLALTRSVATAAAVAAPPPRDRDVVATVGSSPASAPAAPDTSIALLFNGLQSNGYRSESAPVEASASLAIASTAAAPPPASTPAPAVRASSQFPSATPSMSAGRPAAAAPVDRRIYSAADENVAPPSMRRLQMPSEPKPGEVTGDSWIEVLVDERGQVAQVRLHSSKLSLNDRMIVSAAKAWQFEPALKDGNPVKYVLRLPVTR